MNNPSELCHYGIKGMKWGVRRYQNEDGSYTEAGKRRERQKRKAELRSEYRNNRKVLKELSKNSFRLSDEELINRVKRLENEKKLKQLVDELNHPKTSTAKRYMQGKETKDVIGKKAIKTLGITSAMAISVGIAVMPALITKVRNPMAAKVAGITTKNLAKLGSEATRDFVDILLSKYGIKA